MQALAFAGSEAFRVAKALETGRCHQRCLTMAHNVTQDSIAPADPTVSTPPYLTSAMSVALSVTGEDGATIIVARGADEVREPAVGIAQSIVVPLKPNAMNTLKVSATDAAGNVSGEVTRVALMDTVAPAPPIVSSPTSPTSAFGVVLSVAGTTTGSTITVIGGAATVEATATASAQDITVALPSNATIQSKLQSPTRRRTPPRKWYVWWCKIDPTRATFSIHASIANCEYICEPDGDGRTHVRDQDYRRCGGSDGHRQ